MNDLNCCMFIGNMANDAEPRITKQGAPAIRFTVACNFHQNSYSDVYFQDCQAYGKIAEMFEGLKKGDKIWVMGRMRTFKWQDRNGVSRQNVSLLVEQIRMIKSVDTGE